MLSITARNVALMLTGLLFLAACGDIQVAASQASQPAPANLPEVAPAEETSTTEGPPLGRYVCRQHTTTMGYLSLLEGGAYEMSGVRGEYLYDAESGAMEWRGGSFDEWQWDGTYDHVVRADDDGRPDEHVIRLRGRSDGLKIDCFKTAED
jgi:hypothetical protein